MNANFVVPWGDEDADIISNRVDTKVSIGGDEQSQADAERRRRRSRSGSLSILGDADVSALIENYAELLNEDGQTQQDQYCHIGRIKRASSCFA